MSQMPPGPPYPPPGPQGAPYPPPGPQGPPNGYGPPGYGPPPYGAPAPYVVAQPVRSSGPSVGLVLGIIGGVVLVILLGIGGFAFWIYKGVDDTRKEIQTRVERARDEADRKLEADMAAAEKAAAKNQADMEAARQTALANQRRVDELMKDLAKAKDPKERDRIQKEIKALQKSPSTCGCTVGEPLCNCP